ncbi:STAS domain-containing protein [Turneriella parva]|jgi:anti-sigma B factor antagonist|uniref:Anti-sigma factor antagonist n=1 Tax=Turneriella parva (strain ATCC BAA-1111 / DSM 21527 / NCTC 11395 / H) TaxID=869212 RepID=I4B8L1_TURPD|nr:STAS domain-containing protein [Turneriella parva]AFM13618.1 anti-sigma-factor antagonist [Turneriella parva DSM 21527]
MEISQREKDAITILDIQGEIDLYNAPEIKDIIQKLIEAQKYNVIINLEKVSYIDSSGIGALISSLSNLKKYQGGLKIINVYASVKKVFELTKLTSFFEIYESEGEALAKFK